MTGIGEQPDWGVVGPDLLLALRAAEVTLGYRLPKVTDADYALSSSRVTETLGLVRGALARATRSADAKGRRTWWHARFGSNWVLARHTSGIVERYGDDVRCLSQKEYAEAESDWLNGAVP